MKKAFLTAILALTCLGLSCKDFEVGLSLSMFNGKDIPTAAQLQQVSDAGIQWVEVILNPMSSRYCPENESYTRAFRLKSMLDSLGLKVWSCHLPYSKNIDISLTDPSARENALEEDERMIELAGAVFAPKRIVLHPSAEPIADEDRPARLKCSKNSICRLSIAVKKIGAVLCVEDLPRTCLGHTAAELEYLLSDCPEVKVCFDTNHLLLEPHDHFFDVLGPRIGTIHASDYDGVDERHWIEGTGIIDWPRLLANLKACGYKGVFMHEVRAGNNVTPATVKSAYRTVVCGKKK